MLYRSPPQAIRALGLFRVEKSIIENATRSLTKVTNGQKTVIMNDTTKVKQLLKSIDPKVNLTSEAEKMITLMVNDFIEDVTEGACHLAKMRNSKQVEIHDLALYLKKNWDVDVEGYSILTTNSDNTACV